MPCAKLHRLRPHAPHGAAIATRFKEFQSKNKAAKVAGTGIKDKEMGLGSMRALITALPQYHEILSRMSLHIQVTMITIVRRV
jgi:hypothetical protein